MLNNTIQYENETYIQDKVILLKTTVYDADLENNILALVFEKCILIKDIRRNEPICIIPQKNAFGRIKLSLDGSKLFCVNLDDGALIYDTKTGNITDPLLEFNFQIKNNQIEIDRILACDYSSNGKYVSFMSNNLVILWDIVNNLLRVFNRNDGNIILDIENIHKESDYEISYGNTLKFSPDSSMIIFSYHMREICLYNIIESKRKSKILNIPITCCDFSPDSKKIVIAFDHFGNIRTFDFCIQNIDPENNNIMYPQDISEGYNNNYVYDIKFMKNGKNIYTLSLNGTVRSYTLDDEMNFSAVPDYKKRHNNMTFRKLFAAKEKIFLLFNTAPILNVAPNNKIILLELSEKKEKVQKKVILQGSQIIPEILITKDNKYLTTASQTWNLKIGKITSPKVAKRIQEKKDFLTILPEGYSKISDGILLYNECDQYVIVYIKILKAIQKWQEQLENPLFEE